jgi:hypothetical protein
MKPWDKVSSFRDADTLFRGSRIKAGDRRENTERQRRAITEEQITEESSKERPETRSKEIQG